MTDTPEPDPDALLARAAELERKLADLEARAQSRLVAAELKAEAVRAGMIDLDGLKLADASALVLGEDGVVHGAAALVAELRRAKPWLFTAGSSSWAAAAPPAAPPRPRLATEMSVAEWRAARSELLRRR
jgi:hypothetical protein